MVALKAERLGHQLAVLMDDETGNLKAEKSGG
jgi:hypothetical protein